MKRNIDSTLKNVLKSAWAARAIRQTFLDIAKVMAAAWVRIVAQVFFGASAQVAAGYAFRETGLAPYGFPADEFRKNAAMVRSLAVARENGKDQATWLEIAEHWDHLAREADRFHPNFRPVMMFRTRLQPGLVISISGFAEWQW